jgi:hypothetical protein
MCLSLFIYSWYFFSISTSRITNMSQVSHSGPYNSAERQTYLTRPTRSSETILAKSRISRLHLHNVLNANVLEGTLPLCQLHSMWLLAGAVDCLWDGGELTVLTCLPWGKIKDQNAERLSNRFSMGEKTDSWYREKHESMMHRAYVNMYMRALVSKS